MKRSDAEATIRDIATVLVALEHRTPGVHHRIHGATMLLGQVLFTSARMPEPEALTALARAAELAGEVLLLGSPELTPESAAELNDMSSVLISLAHRHVIDQACADHHEAATSRCPNSLSQGRSHA